MFMRLITGLIFGACFALPSFALANMLCVNVDRANLRSGPGNNYKISWTVGRYMPLRHLSNKGIWLRVQDLDNQEHWVNGTMVSSSIQCVVVKAKIAALKRTPSSGAEPSEIPVADRYTPFRKIDREGAWIKVEDEYRERYWVLDTNVWWPVKRSTIKF